MLLTDVKTYDIDVLHLSFSIKTYWWRQLLSNDGNLFVHLIYIYIYIRMYKLENTHLYF